MDRKDLITSYDALISKQPSHSMRVRYYNGDHPIAFINPKFNDVIRKGVVFKKNWCQVIVDATLNKLNIQSWNAPDLDNDMLGRVWRKYLRRIEHDIYRMALVTGESYAIAWLGEDNMPRVYFNDPRNVHVVYDEDAPERMKFAVKTWISNRRRMLNIYYPDRIEHYAAVSEDPINGSAFQPFGEYPVEPNPFGQIPVFHFRVSDYTMTGELTAGVLSLQDALNKILNDMMVASEYASFPQRYAIGNFEKGQTWPVGPGTILELPGSAQGDQPVTVGSFATSSPDNYLRPMDDLRDAMAVLSATPHYYFVGQGGTPSGEAIRALESPLLSKVRRHQAAFGYSWESLMKFVIRLSGMDIDPETIIECIWTDPNTQLPNTVAQTRLINKNAGIPISTQLRDEGWTQEQIEQMYTDINVEATISSIPNTGAIPKTVSPIVAAAARVQAKDELSKAAASSVSNAMDSAMKTDLSDAAIADLMSKFSGRQVRK